MRIGLEDCVIDEHRHIALIFCTEIYTHITNIGVSQLKSPLDNLKLDDK
ncbi:MAG: hypothetical protein J7K89_08465 [Candidatus Cloacimonetes bacterium]|nr:hypothetical protein [Candidatus Cloacimonadota bacterium]